MFRRKRDVNPIIEVKKTNALIFIAYLALGVYFVNKQFNFIKIPEQIIKFDSWITLVAGFFLLLGAIHYFRASR